MFNYSTHILIIIFLNLLISCNDSDDFDKVQKSDTTKRIIKVENKNDTTIVNKSTAHLGEIIENLNTKNKIVALTFDACESNKPSYFDHSILDYLVNEKIPFTLFVSGKFAKRNSDELKQVSEYDFVEIENHSMNHIHHTEKLNNEDIKNEVLENEKFISEITGRKTKFFRFPGGNYSYKSLQILSEINYPVMHWTFASGDPDKNISPKRLYNWVVNKTKPGNILIFHINGRGYSTGAALPQIISTLSENGYRFVKLEDYYKVN